MACNLATSQQSIDRPPLEIQKKKKKSRSLLPEPKVTSVKSYIIDSYIIDTKWVFLDIGL